MINMTADALTELELELILFCEANDLFINRHNGEYSDNFYVMHEDKIIYCSPPRNFEQCLTVYELGIMLAWCKAFVNEGKTLTYYIPNELKL